MDTRGLRVLQGQETVDRVIKYLNQYGNVTLGKGSCGVPDIIFQTRHLQKFGIEVKRCSLTSYKKGIGTTTLTKRQWRLLLHWCKKHDATALLVVELYIKSRPNIFFALNPNVVTERMLNSNGSEYFVFTTWQIIDLGQKLETLFFECVSP